MRRLLPIFSCIFLPALLVSCVANPQPKISLAAASAAPAPMIMPTSAAWCLKPAPSGVVEFHGEPRPNLPPVAIPLAVLVSAPSLPTVIIFAPLAAASFLLQPTQKQAEIAAHDKVNGKVLKPYRAVLDRFTTQELYDGVLDARAPEGAASLTCNAEVPAGVWVLEIETAFAMTQDQSALITETVLIMHPPGSPEAPPGIYIVRVVGARSNANKPQADWLKDDGRKLKDDSIALLGEAIDIALRGAAGESVPADVPLKTYTYMEGKFAAQQSAQVASETCERVLLKIKDGEMWSVPRKPKNCLSGPEHAPAQEPAPTAAPDGPHP